MPSLIPNFEHDIFISYRQKDNKHDGWVTRFVESLKAELESTFKEEISVYFDINPRDGLLETHDVDESLKKKLKCLVFIPVISRTYCDTKAFAWEHEFKEFVKQASADPLGLKLKLSSGNIASRVLPVQIHDISNSDTNLCETVLGGVLRSIPFIYKEPGVNRSLSPDDDIRTNMNKTRYRNQINKVALAIDDIITAIKNQGKPFEEISEKEGKTVTRTESWAKSDKSLAILPFINDSPDEENTYFINGIMEEILNNLQKIKDLRVISRTSVEQYRGQKKSIADIAEELDVNYVVEGSGQKYGNAFRLRMQLVRADRETHLWGESFQQEINNITDIFNIQSRIAESIADALKVIITPHEKQLISKIPTDNLDAYDVYRQGLFYWDQFTPESLQKAFACFEKAIGIDPEFADAHAAVAYFWIAIRQYGLEPSSVTVPKIHENLQKAIELDPDSIFVQYVSALASGWTDFNWEKAEKEFLKVLDANPNHVFGHIYYAHLLMCLKRDEEALAQVNIVLELDPYNPMVLALAAMELAYTLEYEKASEIAVKALQLAPNHPVAFSALGIACFCRNDYKSGIEAWMKYLPIDEKARSSVFTNLEKKGHHAAARKYAEALENSEFHVLIDLWTLYLIAKDDSKVMYIVEKMYENHDANIPYLGASCFVSEGPLKVDDPRFMDFLKKMKLPLK